MSYLSDQVEEPLAPGVIEAVRRHVGVVVLAGAVGLLVALAFAAFVLPERFDASASLTLDDPQQGIFNSRAAPPEEFERYLNGVADFVTSADVLDGAVAVLGDGTDRADLEDATEVTANAADRAVHIQAQAGTADAAVARVRAILDAFGAAHESQLANTAQRAVSALETQITQAEAEVADAEAALAIAPTNLALQSQLDAVIDRVAVLTSRVDEITVNAEAFGSGIAFVDEPRDPETPSSPDRKILGAAGLLAGLIGGMVLAWLYADRHRSVWTSDEPAILIGAPLLGKVPSLRRGELTLVDPEAMPAEPYQFVTSAMLAALRDGRGVVVVASPDAGAGTSVTVANIAVAAALDKRRVAIIDACANEALAGMFGISAHQDGLLDALSDEDEREPELRRVDIGGGSLDILPYGTTSRLTAVNALRSERAGRLLDRLRRRFDLVLVDCPALLLWAVAPAIARWSDGLVLVVQRGTDGGDVTDAYQRVASSGAPLRGYVFTHAAWRERLRHATPMGIDLAAVLHRPVAVPALPAPAQATSGTATTHSAPGESSFAAAPSGAPDAPATEASSPAVPEPSDRPAADGDRVTDAASDRLKPVGDETTIQVIPGRADDHSPESVADPRPDR